MITVRRIKKLLSDNNVLVADARQAWWKTGPGFTVTQSDDKQTISIQPRSRCSEGVERIHAALTSAGITFVFNSHLDVTTINLNQSKGGETQC